MLDAKLILFLFKIFSTFVNIKYWTIVKQLLLFIFIISALMFTDSSKKEQVDFNNDDLFCQFEHINNKQNILQSEDLNNLFARTTELLKTPKVQSFSAKNNKRNTQQQRIFSESIIFNSIAYSALNYNHCTNFTQRRITQARLFTYLRKIII